MDVENLLVGLNSDQRAAVLHDHEKNGQLLILAGAGSGKTSVLTKRIQYRILCGVQPEKILALTFTAKAAAEMRERVQKLFPNAGVRLCTFHSLALFILKSKVPIKFTEQRRSELDSCDSVIRDEKGRSRNKSGMTSEECSCPAYELVGFKKMPVPTEAADKSFMQELAKVGGRKFRFSREELFSDAYPSSLIKKLEPLRNRVLESGQVVFEDLIYQAINLLENHEEARAYFQNQWSEILVDEYQDINPSQYRLVKALLGNRKSLFVVGDDDQAIYGFRGADIGNINRFRDDFKESSLIRLEWNYRSVANILHFSNKIFENKPIHLRKVLRAGNMCGSGGSPIFKENREPEIWVSENPVEEMQKIITSIKLLRESYDLQWKNFAILVRYNRQRLYYEEALRDACLPIAGDMEHLSGEGLDGGEPVEDGIHVETVHASKGLQYAVVYYAGMSEGLTPGTCSGSREQRKKQLDEERRLFYVGVTRAESFLVLLYCKRRYWKGRLTKLKRSRFLPKESSKAEIDMPVILFRIFAAARILLFMLEYIVKIAFMYVFRRKDLDTWLEEKVQKFSWFCMQAIRVDLTIEDQAQLAKVDWTRPVFVMGNHRSYLDIPIAFLALQRTVGFIAKTQLQRIPILNFWMHKLGCVFINREKGGGAEIIQKAVQSGKMPRLFIFPEGTRSKREGMVAFKSGCFRLAVEANAIILPIVTRGSDEAWEHRKGCKHRPVNVKILEPIDTVEFKKTHGGDAMDPRHELLPYVRSKMEEAYDRRL
ncbi:UvrD-helicase domain-containing protein [Fibrobacter sp. UWB11]|uniref:UvrD-helicase domain-containing protein n=1 Tax=Fibrobacter sp. UWB11 TaxID=1896202 RepID=UPI00092C419C|nr:UvrD-helicase domain-containing protein [Fibrobacter sp. UWB11]SIN83582.1 1-acyl-sn-glycerol-3-phosphate acyltransferases [Fibrobacter sp. UWB11]